MRKILRRAATTFVAIVLAVGVASALTSCGKKGALEPPPETEQKEKRR